MVWTTFLETLGWYVVSTKMSFKYSLDFFFPGYFQVKSKDFFKGPIYILLTSGVSSYFYWNLYTYCSHEVRTLVVTLFIFYHIRASVREAQGNCGYNLACRHQYGYTCRSVCSVRLLTWNSSIYVQAIYHLEWQTSRFFHWECKWWNTI